MKEYKRLAKKAESYMVLDTNTGELVCQRCEKRHSVNALLPLEIREFADICYILSSLHAKCEKTPPPKPEGDSPKD